MTQHDARGVNPGFVEDEVRSNRADELHVTGTGQVQERFIHYLAETPQYKHTVWTESTSNTMDDAHLVTFIGEQFKG